MSVRTDVINLNVNINGNKAQADLNNLRKKAGDIRNEMGGLVKGTAEYVAKAKELKGVEANMDALKKTIGITALSQKELVQELNKMKALRGSLVPFSAEFKELSKSIAATEKRLYDVKNGTQGFSSFLGKAGGGIKALGVAAAGMVGFQFLSSQFKNIVTGAAKLSDQLADLRRVTGLTAGEANTLNDELSSLDSRTSLEGLRNIAIVAGKLGVAKKDIFEFTKAVDMLVVALGDELGDANQITETLGKILNVFDGSVNGDNITKLGNAFVELANAGVASGAFIADFDQRLSGIAKSAGIGLGELSGLGAGIEELGGRVESSATAVQKLLITIAQDLPAAAKIAGMSTKEFSKLYSADATEALLRYSEGLVKNKTSFAAVTASLKDAGEEGARTIETITKLGTSSTLLREKILLGKNALEQSSSITEAFRLKNETFGASIDKLGKEFSKLITQSRITDFVKSVVQGFTAMLIPAKSLTDQFREQATVVKKLDTETLPLINRYEELSKKAVLNKDEQVELNNAIVAIGKTIPTAITEFDKYGRALGINATKAREFINLQKLILKEKNRDAVKDQEEVLKIQERDAKALQAQLNRGTVNQTVGGGTGGLGTNIVRKLTTEEITKAQAALALYQERIAGIKGIINELKGENLQLPDPETVLPPPPGGGGTGGGGTGAGGSGDKKKKDTSAADNFAKLKKEAEEYYKEIQNLKKRSEAGDSPGAEEIEAARQKYDKLLAKAKEYFVKNAIDKKRFNEEEKIIEEAQRKEINDIFQKFYQQRMDEQSGKEYEESLAARQQYADDLTTQVTKEYTDGKISKREYEAAITQIELDALKDRITIAQDYSGTVKKAATDVVAFKKAEENRTTADAVAGAEARMESADKEALAMRRRAVLTSRAGSKERLEAEQELIIEQYRQEMEAFDEYSEEYKEKYAELQQELNDLQAEYNQQRIDQVAQYADYVLQALSSISTILANRENAAFNKEKKLNDLKRKEFKRMLDGKLLSQQQYDKKLAELDAQEETRQKEIARRQAKREKALTILSTILSTAAAVAGALAAKPIGPWNIAQAAIFGALGALQVGVAATTPLPELGRGDWIRDGDKHSDPSGGQVVKIERDEAVISAAAMNDRNNYTISGTPAQITSRLNSQAGGVSWAGGAIMQSADWYRRSPSRIASDAPAIMAMGGTNFTRQQNGGSSATDAVLTEVVAQVKEIATAVSRIPTEIRGKWVIKDLDETRDGYEAARKASSMKQ